MLLFRRTRRYQVGSIDKPEIQKDIVAIMEGGQEAFRPTKGNIPAMEAIEIIELISRGEDSRTQFKRDVTNPESLAGDLVAFSNSKGGRIVVGVDDQGNVVGLSPADIRRINQLLANVSTNSVRPSINAITENCSIADKVVMIINVFEGYPSLFR